MAIRPRTSRLKLVMNSRQDWQARIRGKELERHGLKNQAKPEALRNESRTGRNAFRLNNQRFGAHSNLLQSVRVFGNAHCVLSEGRAIGRKIVAGWTGGAARGDGVDGGGHHRV